MATKQAAAPVDQPAYDAESDPAFIAEIERLKQERQAQGEMLQRRRADAAVMLESDQRRIRDKVDGRQRRWAALSPTAKAIFVAVDGSAWSPQSQLLLKLAALIERDLSTSSPPTDFEAEALG